MMTKNLLLRPAVALVLIVTSLLTIGRAAAADFAVRAAANEFAYTINSVGNNPVLTLVRGQTYSFDVNACGCHPFQIIGAPVGSVVNNNISQGTLIFAVPLTATNYTYKCSVHLFGNSIATIAPPSAPTVSTTAASGISSAGASLNGLVNPVGQTTTASFVYGTDPTLATGTLPTAGQTIGNGAASVAVTADITGLQPSTMYYFRTQASNAGGTTLGGILSFPTLSNNADLSILTLSSGTMSPVFVIGTTNYTASVSNATTSITITPTVAQSNASLTVNGSPAVSGNGRAVSLSTGANTITIQVTAQDGTTKKTLSLVVTRMTYLETWRQTHFPGSTAIAGPGSDTSTPQNDGIMNLIKFATGMDPAKPGIMPGTGGGSGGSLTLTYTPSIEAVADGVAFTVEYSETLGVSAWASDIVDQGVIGPGGAAVTATVPNGDNSHRFLRLKIAAP